MLRPLLALVLSLGLACSGDSPIATDEQVISDEGELGKADGASELKVRAGETSVWVRSTLELRGDETPTIVMRGRSSRNLEDGRAFIMDDIFGDFAIIGPRSFEVSWPVGSARTLLDGVDQFVSLDLVHSSSRPDRVTAHVVVRPRLGSFAGASQIYLVAALTPVLRAGQLVYRLRGNASSDVLGVSARAGTLALPAARLVDARHFELDVEPAQALALLAGDDAITVAVQLASGTVEKTARLGVSLHELGLTDGDAYEVWPHDCEDDTRACLEALPTGTADLAECGDAFTVQGCADDIGVRVEQAELDTRIAMLDTQLGDGFATDAAALVGSDRADAFASRTRTAITEALLATRGRWFLDGQAQSSALDTVAADAIDRAYAFPLLGFAPRVAAPGDEAATRELVADALLAYLAEQDYLHSAFGRSYLELTREYRAQHLASLRTFREDVVGEDYPGDPTLDVYVADWLGAYTEVSVDAATGTPTRVYVELD